MKKAKCEVCGAKATKAVRHGEYRMLICKKCSHEIAQQLRKAGIPLEDGGIFEFGRPYSSLMQHLSESQARSEILREASPSVVFLWLYPHEDWALAVESGMTDRPSYQDYAHAIAESRSQAESQGIKVILITTRIPEFLAELDRRGLDNTPDNRAKLICEFGVAGL